VPKLVVVVLIGLFLVFCQGPSTAFDLFVGEGRVVFCGKEGRSVA
jgi:hypothetical protein